MFMCPVITLSYHVVKVVCFSFKNADITVFEKMFIPFLKLYAAYPSVLKVDQQRNSHHNTNKNQPFWSGK